MLSGTFISSERAARVIHFYGPLCIIYGKMALHSAVRQYV